MEEEGVKLTASGCPPGDCLNCSHFGAGGVCDVTGVQVLSWSSGAIILTIPDSSICPIVRRLELDRTT